MAQPVPAILPYTVTKLDDVPTLLFLLWRDRRSSAVESSTFWSSVVCPLGKTDHSALDAVCRAFSEKSKGAFAPAAMAYDSEHELDAVARKSPAKQKVEESKIALRRKIRAGQGVTLLSVRQYVTYVAPVRYVSSAALAALCAADKGEPEWVRAEELLVALDAPVPDNIVTVRTRPFDGESMRTRRAPEGEEQPKPLSLPLALPFTATMRAPESRKELAAILQQFGINVPQPSPAAAQAAAAAPAAAVASSADAAVAAAATPDVASLSLQESKSGAAEADPAAGAVVAPAAAAAASSSAASSSAAAAAAPAEAAAKPAATVQYACRKCRTVLFSDTALTSHTLPRNTAPRFAHKHVKGGENHSKRAASECTLLWVEPAALGDFAESEGALLCKKCSTRYGNFDWAGMQCSCGEWIVPAFGVVKSKVDSRAVGGMDRSTHVAFSFVRPPPRVPPAAATAGAAAAPAAPAAADAPASAVAEAPAAASDAAPAT